MDENYQLTAEVADLSSRLTDSQQDLKAANAVSKQLTDDNKRLHAEIASLRQAQEVHARSMSARSPLKEKEQLQTQLAVVQQDMTVQNSRERQQVTELENMVEGLSGELISLKAMQRRDGTFLESRIVGLQAQLAFAQNTLQA